MLKTFYSEEIVEENQEEEVASAIDADEPGQPEIVEAAPINNLENTQPQMEGREEIPLPVEEPNEDNASATTNEQELLEPATHTDQGAMEGTVVNYDE